MIRSSHYLGNNRALTLTTDGLKLFLDTRDLSLTPHILLDGFWEQWVAKHIRSTWAQPGMTIFEIGSNMGYYTTLMAFLVKQHGRIIGFEPVPHVAKMARESLDINGLTNAKIVELVVGDQDGLTTFTTCKDHQGSSSLYEVDQIAPSERVERSQMKMVTLDTFCVDEGIYPDFLKIDAEGAEPAILRGAKRLIDSYRINKILLEVNIPMLELAGESAEEMLDSLRARQFSLTEVHHEGLRPAIYSAIRKAGVCEIYAER